MRDMRKALVVGINYYQHEGSLYGCVDDAHAVKALLQRNSDGSVNFDVELLTASGPMDVVTRRKLKDSISELFSTDEDVAVFYFAGHGHIETTGGYLLASDARHGDEGVSLDEILILANESKARNKVIVLDSCHSGIAGTSPPAGRVSILSEGLTILTASTKDQYSVEQGGGGVFTKLFVDALSGSAANLVGEVSPGSVYAHIDQSLGRWMQRPVLKTNVKSFVPLRRVQAPLDLAELQRITEFFPSSGYQYPLNPSYEPELKGRDPGMPPPDRESTRKFAILQRYNRVNLVVPVGVRHMWNAAMASKTCRLTVLGEHYRRLVAQGRI
jgi:hypothetical protein